MIGEIYTHYIHLVDSVGASCLLHSLLCPVITITNTRKMVAKVIFTVTPYPLMCRCLVGSQQQRVNGTFRFRIIVAPMGRMTQVVQVVPAVAVGQFCCRNAYAGNNRGEDQGTHTDTMHVVSFFQPTRCNRFGEMNAGIFQTFSSAPLSTAFVGYHGGMQMRRGMGGGTVRRNCARAKGRRWC